MTTIFRVEIPALRALRPDDRRAIAGALLDAARVWLEGHTLRRSLDARAVAVTAVAPPPCEAPAPVRSSLPLPGVSHAENR